MQTANNAEVYHDILMTQPSPFSFLVFHNLFLHNLTMLRGLNNHMGSSETR